MRACAVRRGARRERGRGGGAREKRSSLARWLLRSRHLGGGGLLVQAPPPRQARSLFGCASSRHGSQDAQLSATHIVGIRPHAVAKSALCSRTVRRLSPLHGRLGAHYKAGRKEVAQRPGEELNKRERKKVRRGRGARGRAGREGRGEGGKEEGRMRRREGLQALVRGARPERRGRTKGKAREDEPCVGPGRDRGEAVEGRGSGRGDQGRGEARSSPSEEAVAAAASEGGEGREGDHVEEAVGGLCGPRGVSLSFAAPSYFLTTMGTARRRRVSGSLDFKKEREEDAPTMTTTRMAMPTAMRMRIFMSFHHICLRTRLAPRRNPCALCARLSASERR